jgi:PadR family transcriptional regulator, regulatory protein PadR
MHPSSEGAVSPPIFGIFKNNTLHYRVGFYIIGLSYFFTTIPCIIEYMLIIVGRKVKMEINKEVLKGHIDTLILSLLQKRDMYGYELAKLVRERSENQFELKEGTLYLSLKRLEKNKWISSYWGAEQGPGGRRKYYKLTPLGEDGVEQKREEWEFIKKIMDSFLERGE